MRDLSSYFESYNQIIELARGNELKFDYATAFANEFTDDIAKIGGEANPKRVIYGMDIFNIKDQNGNSPLHWAVKNKNLPMICFLISQGADFEARNVKGKTFMDLMGKHFSEMTPRALGNAHKNIENAKHVRPKIIKLSECSDKEYTMVVNNFLDTIKNQIDEDESLFEDGRKLIHLAALHGKKHLVDELIERGEDVDRATIETKITPLMSAVISGSPETVSSILEVCKDVNSIASDGSTALHAALISKNFDSAKVLLAHPDIDVSIVNKEGKTALQICENEEVRELIAAKTTAAHAQQNNISIHDNINEASNLLTPLVNPNNLGSSSSQVSSNITGTTKESTQMVTEESDAESVASQISSSISGLTRESYEMISEEAGKTIPQSSSSMSRTTRESTQMVTEETGDTTPQNSPNISGRKRNFSEIEEAAQSEIEEVAQILASFSSPAPSTTSPAPFTNPPAPLISATPNADIPANRHTPNIDPPSTPKKPPRLSGR